MSDAEYAHNLRLAVDGIVDDMLRSGLIHSNPNYRAIVEAYQQNTRITTIELEDEFRRWISVLNDVHLYSDKHLHTHYVSNKVRTLIARANTTKKVPVQAAALCPYPFASESSMHVYMAQTFSPQHDANLFSHAWYWAIGLYLHEGIEEPLKKAMVQASKAKRLPNDLMPYHVGKLSHWRTLWTHPDFAGLCLAAEASGVTNWESLLEKRLSAQASVANTVRKSTGLKWRDALSIVRLSLPSEPSFSEAYAIVQRTMTTQAFDRVKNITLLPDDLDTFLR